MPNISTQYFSFAALAACPISSRSAANACKRSLPIPSNFSQICPIFSSNPRKLGLVCTHFRSNYYLSDRLLINTFSIFHRFPFLLILFLYPMGIMISIILLKMFLSLNRRYRFSYRLLLKGNEVQDNLVAIVFEKRWFNIARSCALSSFISNQRELI